MNTPALAKVLQFSRADSRELVAACPWCKAEQAFAGGWGPRRWVGDCRACHQPFVLYVSQVANGVLIVHVARD